MAIRRTNCTLGHCGLELGRNCYGRRGVSEGSSGERWASFRKGRSSAILVIEIFPPYSYCSDSRE